MRDYAFYNGVFTPYDACVIPLSDRSIFFGDAVYDVILGRNGIPYQLDEHLDRLMENARRIGLDDIPARATVKEAISSVIELSEADCFMLYIQLSGNERRRKHLRDCGDVNLLITITAAEIPERLETVSAITMQDNRYGYCNLKTTNLLPAVLSMSEASLSGADLAIFHKNGLVTECSAANVSIIKNGELVTHPLDTSILPGISERNLIRVCSELGIPHLSRKFTVSEMLESDAVLITSTTKFVKVCDRIDGVELRRGCDALTKEIFRMMSEDFVKNTQ